MNQHTLSFWVTFGKCENVIELVDGTYKIKPNQDKNLINDQNFKIFKTFFGKEP